MKVISGFLKGRNIQGYHLENTRPTMDRVKESFFAMIQESVPNSVCLDLFAGSGSLGIEAISNGSDVCYFVDRDKNAIETINKNIRQLSIQQQAIVLKMDYQKALQYFNEQNITFDLIFLDPPYKEKYITDILMKLDQSSLLRFNGLVVCECDNLSLLEEYTTLKKIKEKKYGDKYVIIYKKNIDKM